MLSLRKRQLLFCLTEPTFSDEFIALSQSTNTRRFLSLGRNTVRTPGEFDLDLAVGREFQVTERSRLRLRAEAFNILNHTNFKEPSSALTVTTNSQAGDFQLAWIWHHYIRAGRSFLAACGAIRVLKESALERRRGHLIGCVATLKAMTESAPK
jgi:hypothetical protein